MSIFWKNRKVPCLAFATNFVRHSIDRLNVPYLSQVHQFASCSKIEVAFVTLLAQVMLWKADAGSQPLATLY